MVTKCASLSPSSLRWWCIVAALVQAVSLSHASLVNEDVTRIIDLTTHLANVVSEVNVLNSGKTAVFEYKIGHAQVDGTLAYISAQPHGRDEDLPVSQNTIKVNIPAGKRIKLTITQVYIHSQTPLPAEIKQKDAQYVKTIGNLYFSSPYPTTSQTTSILMAGKPESVAKVKPYKQDGQKVTYGPYTDTGPNEEIPFHVHFESYTPFLTATKLVREIMVSHWGSATVTEDVSLYHSGAKLVGEFSRLDMQRDPRASRTAVKTITTRLPAAATDVFYRDIIGNISTSNLREESDAVIVEIQPRFPLFGGWKTQYSLSYKLPPGEILSLDGSKYVMSTRFVGHIYDNMAIDEAEIRVVLPEGAQDIDIETPFPIDEQHFEKTVTYFDTKGRPVIVLKKYNLVEEHMQELSVSYTMPTLMNLREPAIIVAFFVVLFLAAVFLNRIDLSISADPAAIKKKE